jgi:hypothetical protein
MNIFLAILVIFIATGCSIGTPKPQTGGGASVNANLVPQMGRVVTPVDPYSPPSASITQPQNPDSASSQDVSYQIEETIEYPIDTVKETTTTYPDGRSLTIREPIPAGTKVVKKSSSNVNQEIGGSWKDTAREFGAALGSFAVVQYIGIGVLLFGAVSFFNLGLRTLIGGKDVSLALAACGGVMMFGPFILVKYSNYFFLAIVAAGLYWLVTRLKYKEALLDAKNGKA